MPTQYFMRAFKTAAPKGYVYWTVNNAPDPTGAQSGYPTNELTNIVVNNVIVSSIPILPGIQYATLMENPIGTVGFTSITQDMVGSAFTFSLSGGTNLQVGQALTTPAFTSTLSGTLTSANLTNTFNGENLNVLSTPNSFSSTVSIPQGTENTFGANVAFTLHANNGIATKTSSTVFNWYQYSYFGVGTANQTGSGFITGLGNHFITNARGTTFTVNPSNQKIYFSCRSAYGAATFTVGGFQGGFTKTQTVSVTNAFGFSENYDLYESDQLLTGSTTVQVS